MLRSTQVYVKMIHDADGKNTSLPFTISLDKLPKPIKPLLTAIMEGWYDFTLPSTADLPKMLAYVRKLAE